MEEKVTLEVTAKQLEVIYRGLLELPSKYSLNVIQELEKQVKEQVSQPGEDTEAKPEDVKE